MGRGNNTTMNQRDDRLNTPLAPSPSDNGARHPSYPPWAVCVKESFAANVIKNQTNPVVSLIEVSIWSHPSGAEWEGAGDGSGLSDVWESRKCINYLGVASAAPSASARRTARSTACDLQQRPCPRLLRKH